MQTHRQAHKQNKKIHSVHKSLIFVGDFIFLLSVSMSYTGATLLIRLVRFVKLQVSDLYLFRNKALTNT